MKQIIRGRRSGKTTGAIKLSAETGSYIVVANRAQVDIIAKTARELGINIPYPMTAEEVTRLYKSQPSISRKGVIVDEALYVLQELLKVKVNGVTISTNEDAIIEHNPKVKVPQFIANTMNVYDNLQEMLAEEYYNNSTEEIDSDRIQCWIDENFNTLCRAWLDGYEIEEEPKYYVALPYLGFMTSSKDYPFTGSKEDAARSTESEIKELDERYWAFAVPIEKEVAE